MRTKEELTSLKKEFEELDRKLSELNDDELAQITAGAILPLRNTDQMGMLASNERDASVLGRRPRPIANEAIGGIQGLRKEDSEDNLFNK